MDESCVSHVLKVMRGGGSEREEDALLQECYANDRTYWRMYCCNSNAYGSIWLNCRGDCK